MRFGFLAHPTSVGLLRTAKMLDLAERLSRDLDGGYDRSLWQRRNVVPLVDVGEIRSATGARCEGVLRCLPVTHAEILADPRRAQARILAAIQELRERGAELVGLGGFTSIVGRHGLETLARSPVPVTSGNSLTAYAAREALHEALRGLEVAPSDARVAVVGYPGSIAQVLANLLLEDGCRVDLVHRGSSTREALLAGIDSAHRDRITLVDRIEDCLRELRFFVTATSSGGVIDPDLLLPGSVVVDVALPRDVIEGKARRRDIVVIDGGYINAAKDVSFGEDPLNLAPRRRINGCVAETMVLALEGRPEAFSIGRRLAADRVLEIGRAALRHGFEVRPMAAYGERIAPAEFAALRRHHHPGAMSMAGARADDDGAPGPDELTAGTTRRFGEHVNPVLADFYRLHRIDRVFVKARGCTLTDADGREYLDMVAGYGCLNLGHNHPAVVRAVREHLDLERPTFVQYVSMPREISRLAERLCQIAPGKMGRVYFSNSGAEAVEAALKLARAATGRRRFIYTDNGYHGKTFGALSVTGNERHRGAFYPLVEGCARVPFGDIQALLRELAAGDVAAFIVEPIQGEGGVVVPPAGYLAAAARACRGAGALFVLDEIQTGFGRTGRMFACEWEDVEPDILCVAKSLSGGLVPIGATLCRADIWDAAYGTAGRFMMHTSTFGGNDLAGAAGLAALEVLGRGELAANALAVGGWLADELHALARDFGCIREVRGRGLMLAIEFTNSFAGAFEEGAREFAARLPGEWSRVYRFLPDRARQHISLAVTEIEGALEEMLTLRTVTKLAQDHGILTFVTANRTNVMRVQPPLLLSGDQASRFVAGLRAACEDLSTFLG